MGRKISNCDIISNNQRKEQPDVDNRDEKQYSEAHLHNKLEAPIFKLNIDCLNKIFDYLSFSDVNSIGQTCKPIHQIAGEYFQANHVTEAWVDYKAVKYGCKNFKADEFGQFIQNLEFLSVYPSNSVKKLAWYVGKYYNQQFKQMRFYEVDLTGEEIQNLRDKFEKVESVAFERCVVNRKFYERFPMLCKNLRRLYIEDFNCRQNVSRRSGNEWLLWAYPNLNHLQWTQSKDWRTIHELELFFARNPQIRSFTTDIDSLWINRNLFSRSEIILDDLTIEMGNNHQEPRDIEHIYSFLKALHAKGVYKRLHINLKRFSQRTLEEMLPLDSLKSMSLEYNVDNPSREPSHHITLPKWLNLTELNILSCCTSINLNAIARQLVNLRRIFFRVISLSDLMPFVCYSVHLTKMKLKYFYCDDEFDFQVAALNKEREKLEGARRMAIYVEEHVYLQSKWKVNAMEYSLIEVRRATSDEWCHQYGPQE